MSVRRLAEVQPEGFTFTAENELLVKQQLAKYPPGRQASAVIPVLWLAQKQSGYWLPEPAIRHVADRLDMAYIRVLEIATFYTMFNLEPVGRHHVQLCGTTPCWLRGADDLKVVCREVIGEQRHVTEDGALSWIEVECLGACCNAPMVQINDDYYEDLTAETFRKLLDDLCSGREVKVGSQTGRVTSEPAGGATTLTTADLLTVIASRAKPGLSIVEDKPEPAAEEPKTAAPPPPEPKPAPPPEPKAVETKPAAPTPAPAPAASPAPPESAAQTPVAAPTTPSGDVQEAEPALYDAAPEAGANDLKRISGVGPKLEKLLNSLGIYRFDQIAEWTPENVAWVDARLTFKGRIERDNWIDQATAFATENSD